MGIGLCLFDLDNTLLRTTDLEPFRGRDNVGVTSADYTRRLIDAAFGPRAPARHLYTQAQLTALRDQYPGVRWGVFTRSPRHYAATLLGNAYPAFQWDVVVGYEDVRNTKPHPDGVWVAGQATGMESTDQIVLVGDEKVDVVCAYRAGCWAFVDQTTWQPREREHWWALERLPDALFEGADELAPLLANPGLRLPELEYLIAGQQLEGRRRRVEKINHFFPRTMGGGYVPIHVMGRLFGEYEEIRPRRQWHALTDQILAHKDATDFPAAWVDAIGSFVKNEGGFSRNVVVTVIPFKPGRRPRLEALLGQVEAAHVPSPRRGSFIPPNDFEFVPDILAFRPGAVSSHGNHLNAQERFANVGDNLYVQRPDVVEGKHVIVIDDVVTTGASLLWAHRYLTQAGASRVSCLSLAQAIGAN